MSYGIVVENGDGTKIVFLRYQKLVPNRSLERLSNAFGDRQVLPETTPAEVASMLVEMGASVGENGVLRLTSGKTTFVANACQFRRALRSYRERRKQFIKARA